MKLRDLQERRTALVMEMRGITDKPAGNGGDLSAEQAQKFDALKADLTGLEKSIERQAFLDEAERRAAGTPVTGSGDAAFDTELRQFSLVKAIAAKSGLSVDDGREREMSAELERRSGRKAQGVMVPMSVFEKRVLTTALPAGGPGSNLISTDHRGDLYFDRLRARLVIRRLGATVLSGLVGNVDIPALAASATAGWVAENAALTPSDPEFRQVTMGPKHAGAIVELSRNMLMQTSPDIEALIRDDLAKVLAEAVDRVAIKGGGTNEPDGILETSGIGSVALGDVGAALTWDDVNDLVAQVEVDDADAGALAFLTNAKVRNSCRKALKVSGDAGAGFIWSEPAALAGYPAAVTSLVPSNLTKSTGTALSAMIFGNFNDMLMGFWSELDILVNPFESTAYAKGNVQVRAMMTLDLAIRHPQSFAAITDIVTA